MGPHSPSHLTLPIATTSSMHCVALIGQGVHGMRTTMRMSVGIHFFAGIHAPIPAMIILCSPVGSRCSRCKPLALLLDLLDLCELLQYDTGSNSQSSSVFFCTLFANGSWQSISDTSCCGQMGS
uniref:Uncharacterized protein n=1 Tax=Eutreptiella gymnastica TaxID=73025 RepID=A0A7S1J3P1_9EUGL